MKRTLLIAMLLLGTATIWLLPRDQISALPNAAGTNPLSSTLSTRQVPQLSPETDRAPLSEPATPDDAGRSAPTPQPPTPASPKRLTPTALRRAQDILRGGIETIREGMRSGGPEADAVAMIRRLDRVIEIQKRQACLRMLKTGDYLILQDGQPQPDLPRQASYLSIGGRFRVHDSPADADRGSLYFLITERDHPGYAAAVRAHAAALRARRHSLIENFNALPEAIRREKLARHFEARELNRKPNSEITAEQQRFIRQHLLRNFDVDPKNHRARRP